MQQRFFLARICRSTSTQADEGHRFSRDDHTALDPRQDKTASPRRRLGGLKSECSLMAAWQCCKTRGYPIGMSYQCRRRSLTERKIHSKGFYGSIVTHHVGPVDKREARTYHQT